MRDTFFKIGRDLLGRGGLIWLASLASLQFCRLTISWFRQPTYRLKSVSWLTARTD